MDIQLTHNTHIFLQTFKKCCFSFFLRWCAIYSACVLTFRFKSFFIFRNAVQNTYQPKTKHDRFVSCTAHYFILFKPPGVAKYIILYLVHASGYFHFFEMAY